MAAVLAKVLALLAMDANSNPSLSIYWRASLVPAAAVIPAPEVYANVVAVKKLVVDSRVVII